jgi:hypothetical protein
MQSINSSVVSGSSWFRGFAPSWREVARSVYEALRAPTREELEFIKPLGENMHLHYALLYKEPINTVKDRISTIRFRSKMRYLFRSLVALGLLGLTYKLLRKFLFNNERMHYIKSLLIEWFMIKTTLKPETVRMAFTGLSLSEAKEVPGHTHGIAAGDRTAASHFIDRLAAQLGREAFYYAMSQSDQRNSRKGSRSYYWTKDVTTEVESFDFPEFPLLAMVDTDHHIEELEEFLCNAFEPIILYTFQPDQVSKITKNYSYTFGKQNEVHYHVTGGATYEHRVWHYNQDNLMVVDSLCGLPLQAATFLVDRRRTSPDHELIMLTPVGKWRGVMAWFVLYCLDYKRLHRLDIAQSNGFNRMTVCSEEGLMVSTGKTGSFSSTKIPITTDETLATLVRTKEHKLTMPEVQSLTAGDKAAAAPLLEYHRLAVESDSDKTIAFPVGEGVRRYQFNPHKFNERAKPSLVQFMRPIVNGAFSPDQTVANEQQMIKGRIEDVKNGELPVGAFLKKTMLKFLEIFVPEALVHTRDPVDYETVLARQSLNKQRVLLTDAEWCESKYEVGLFMKKEAAKGLDDPRPITKLDTVTKREYSQYIYAIEYLFKREPWYAFSLKPNNVAARVAEICQSAEFVTNTDFSRFDGHVSNVLRELEAALLTRCFKPCYTDEVLSLHSKQFGQSGIATFGTAYEMGFARGSGSPETSLFNSLCNAFVAFLAISMTIDPLTNKYYEGLDAYVLLGLYGGDDGITANVEPTTYIKAAAMVGQVLDVEKIMRGHVGVKFLARCYSPYIWEGDRNSCCQMLRTLKKFHVTVSMGKDVTPTMKLLEKIRCFSLTDLNTPIIGDFCYAVMKWHGGEIEHDERTLAMRPWWARFDRGDQYPNADADWMWDLCDSEMPIFQHKKFSSWLKTCNRYSDFLEPPLCLDIELPKPKVPVVIEEVLLPYDVKLEKEEFSKKDLKTISKMNGEHSSWKIASTPKSFLQQAKDVESKHKPLIATAVAKSEKATAKAKESFEALKARKIAAGTWVEKPKSKG